MRRETCKSKILALASGPLTEESLEEIKDKKLDKVREITNKVFGYHTRSDDLKTCPLCLITTTRTRFTKRHVSDLRCKWKNINKHEKVTMDDEKVGKVVNEETPTPAVGSMPKTVLTNLERSCGFPFGQLPSHTLNNIEEEKQLTPFDGLLKTDKFEQLEMWKAENEAIIFYGLAPVRTEEQKKSARESLMKATKCY